MSISLTTIDDIGAFTDLPKLSVDSTSAVSHTVTSGKKGVIFMNVGATLCWMGGSTIDPANSRGIIMIPKVYFMFRNATNDFKIYFKCESGQTTTIGILEYS
jgi:hypothetical protein